MHLAGSDSVRLRQVVLEHRVIDEPVASDHRPLLAVLRLR